MKKNDTPLKLPDGQLDIWIAATAHVADYMRKPRYESLLNTAEKEHYQSLQYPEHRYDYLLSRCLLRTALAQYTNQEPEELIFERNEYGKPELVSDRLPYKLQFNLSLTDGLAICAVTRDAALGVDVEYHGHGKSMVDVADEYFSELELAELNSLPKKDQKAGFFRYWTLKESLIKARGEGMSVPLDSFAFRTLSDDQHGVKAAALVNFPQQFIPYADRWSFRYFDLGAEYTAAVSVSKPIKKICFRESVPLVGCMEFADPEALFSQTQRDALASAF